MKNVFLLIILLSSHLIISAQKEKNIWYFGDKAGLDFNSGSIVAIDNSEMLTYDNCASVANSTTGELLFYSNGINVWDKNHEIMPNGYDLLGSLTGGNSAFAVKQPEKDNIYYLFTSDAFAGPNGLNYSIIDLSLNNGNGDVTLKNQRLLSSATEKITAIKHYNGKDIWIITHAWNSNEFYTYLLTSAGLKPTPVKTSIGSTHSGGTLGTYNAMGQISCNKAGNKLAVAIYDLNVYELFDFNRATGKLSNPISISDYAYAWGAEFSPDGRYLYTSQWGGSSASVIRQFDISSNSESAINNSGVIIGNVESPHPVYKAGYLQLGPDNKIYIAKFTSKYIGVINNPDKKGQSCNFEDTGVYLGGNICEAGLPSFLQTTIDRTEVKDESKAQSISLYPNPFSTQTMLQLEQPINNASVIIANSIGQTLVQMDNVNQQSLTIYRGNLPSGVYFISILQKNKIVVSKKAIIID